MAVQTPWKGRLGFEAPAAAYLILLDPKGVVRWRYDGTFSEEAYGEMGSAVNALQEAMHH
jgi:hypothetical protein